MKNALTIQLYTKLMRLLFTIFLIACASMAQAQNASISGKIMNESGEAIPGVSIRILNTNLTTTTNDNGEYQMNELRAGKYRLLFSAIGFASKETEINLGESGAVSDITLVESVKQLDDVIVTAQKTEEDLQGIAFSLSALSSREVEEYRIWNTREITAIVPNLYSANPGDNRNVTSIRGIASTSYDPAVATYVDGINQFTLDTYVAQLFDIERIEVLRGPQGTLYGRNAMAGVINIITKEPGNQTRGFAEVSIGNYGQQRYAAGVRSPIVNDKLFFGASALYDRASGFYTNTFDNSDFDKKHNFTGNYYLKYLASRHTSFTLNVKHSSNRNNGTFPMTGSVEDAFDKPFEVNQNAVSTMVDNLFNGSLNINHSGNALNFTSLTTYQRNYRIYKKPLDGDFSPIDGVTIINNYGKDWNNTNVLTQEFKLASQASSSSNLRWTAGSYLFYQKSPTKQATHFGADAAFIDPNAMPFSAVLNTSTGKSRGLALYGQATYAISKLEITAGLRFDSERKEQQVKGEFLIDGVDEPVFVTQPDTSASATFNSFSPKLSIAYHIRDNQTVYITGSRGFRAGGLTQISPDPSQAPLYSYKPEHSFNLEAGMKNSVLNDKLVINFAAYYINVNDAQVPTLVLPEALTVTRNAGELTSKGVELELSAKPLAGLQIDYALGLTDATYQELNVPQGDGTAVSLKGNRQIFTPSHTSMLAVQYSHNITDAIRIVARGEWQMIGDQYFDLGNQIKQDGYSLLNTRVGFAGKDFEVMFWGRNLTDELFIAYAYDFGATHLGDPRNFGVTISKTFGRK
jgi:iron complex outermembrane recepter protein